uniref:Hedgehog N-terminal signalling domain-containing protein n=1 Tax=Romanomermis culicivorax TaxID=13658 RepID=A0A915LAR1_ROMCU
MDYGEKLSSRRTRFPTFPCQKMPIFAKFFLLSAFILFADLSRACFPGGRMIRRRPRRENPLMYDERVPNIPENSIEAAGRPEKPIRGSSDPRYADLVENYNENIIFKDKDDYPVSRKMSRLV